MTASTLLCNIHKNKSTRLKKLYTNCGLVGYDEVFNKIAFYIRGQQDEAAIFFEM
jgi:hypothetical protein